jgi:thiol-disulfide isomerase/thioredoxin
MRSKILVFALRAANVNVIILLVLTGFPAIAQSEERESIIGRPCPDYIFSHVQYYDTEYAKPKKVDVNELKGKWLILDFWTRNCEPCIKGFPKLNQWQKDFSSDAQFMLVGLNDRYNWQIESYYAGVRAALELELPVAYDTVLVRKLGVYYVPYLVMIDPNGIVRKIVPTKDITKEQISKIIRNEN